MKTFACTTGRDTKYEIRITAVRCGADVNVSICGGSLHHIGAVAVASGRMPDGSALQYSPAVSCITCPDHKDDRIARRAAGQIAEALGTTVSVTAGIHIDDAAPDEIRILMENAEEAVGKIIDQLREAE